MNEGLQRARDLLTVMMSDPSGITLEGQRASYLRWSQQFPAPEGTMIEPLDIAEGLWVSAPESEQDRVVIHLHGGVYRIGSALVHQEIGARVARAAKARVALLDYPLSPEHPFPAAPNATVAAYRALLERYDPKRIAISGESAGGGLALASLLKIRDEGLPLPGAAVLNSPWVDLTVSSASMQQRANRDPMVSAQILGWAAAGYLGDVDPRTPYASPLFGDLKGLPPILIQVGTEETLFDESLALLERAVADNVDARLIITGGAVHIMQHFSSFLPEAALSIQEMGDHIIRNTSRN